MQAQIITELGTCEAVLNPDMIDLYDNNFEDHESRLKLRSARGEAKSADEVRVCGLKLLEATRV